MLLGQIEGRIMCLSDILWLLISVEKTAFYKCQKLLVTKQWSKKERDWLHLFYLGNNTVSSFE